MPTSRSYTLSNITLLKFNKDKQLVVLDRGLTSETKINDVFVMRHPNNAQAYVKLWTDTIDGATTLEVDVTDTLPTGYTETSSKTYSFNGLAGDLWLDGNCVIVGTGDIRDVAVAAFIDKFPLPTSTSDALLITSIGNFTLRVYWKTTGPSNCTIPYSVVVNPN